MVLTPALCRGARALLGWTIEDLAAISGVGISTITSFEGAQRTPIRANLLALARALEQGGAILLDVDEHGRGLRIGKTAEAVRDLLLIGAFSEPEEYRLRRAKQRILKFQSDATEFYSAFFGVHNGAWDKVRVRVEGAMQELRERVDREIEWRIRLGRDDEPTRFLEPITDHLHDTNWSLPLSTQSP
jgi:transcriptional regulator with XRE-family HTH domain